MSPTCSGPTFRPDIPSISQLTSAVAVEADICAFDLDQIRADGIIALRSPGVGALSECCRRTGSRHGQTPESSA
jgi:hypothetical protein